MGQWAFVTALQLFKSYKGKLHLCSLSRSHLQVISCKKNAIKMYEVGATPHLCLQALIIL